MKRQIKKIAVISSGNGGQSMAAYFAYLGYRVALYARETERVEMFSSFTFTITGAINATAEVELISSDMGQVIKNAELIMVTTPAQYHPIVARAMAPHLTDGQAVVLNPGRTFGTMAFSRVLSECGAKAEIMLGETDTFTFTCRCPELRKPQIYKIKDVVRLAAHDNSYSDRLLALLHEIFEMYSLAESVLYTGFANVGTIFHPMPILMNITRVEAKEDFKFYVQGISPLVASMLEKMDLERISVANAYGVSVPTARRWLAECYGSRGNSLYERIQNTEAYKTVLAPTDIDTRYIFEDILTGCVPTSCAGKAAGIDTEVLDTLIKWASILYGRDFRAEGRNENLVDFESFLQ
ncbi:MAG: NAD/NADP octopine/nopaline dehydrogenase family protein [Oscillospiraceae bacterium]|nr:NAD/NADP octopine/nopaline dehydrogenase family protein [Oscillospiraceae bacterium]MCL2278212.1 NAD/NADP octopine/nopaline dehydrogenase family protein [Oscillospiraceae bacterium]